METRQAHTLDALRRVQRFLDDNAAKVTGCVSPATRTLLDDAVVDLDTHFVAQATNTSIGFELTKTRDRQRRTLVREQMAELVRLSRVVIPVEARSLAFRLPNPREAEPKLASRAIEMADAAAQHHAELAAGGLAPDFVATLRQTAEALMASRQAHAKCRVARGVATNGLRERLVSARQVVKVLDVQVRKAARGDAGLLKGWQLARHVVRSGTVAAAAPANVTPTNFTPTVRAA